MMAGEISSASQESKVSGDVNTGKGVVLGEAFAGRRSSKAVASEVTRMVHKLASEQLAPTTSIIDNLIPGADRCAVLVFDVTKRQLHPEVTVNLPEEFLPVLAHNEERENLLTMAAEQADPFLLIHLPGNEQFSFLWRLAQREGISALWLVPWRDRNGSLLGALLFALSEDFSPDRQALASVTLLTDWMTMALHEAQPQLGKEGLRTTSFSENSGEAVASLREIEGVAGIDHALHELLGRHQGKTGSKLSYSERRKRAEPDVVSVLSHELLSPLTLIKGYAATLLQLGEEITEEQQRQYLRSIESASNRLSGLLENFRDLSRLEAGILNLIVESTSLPDLLRKTISETQNQTIKHIVRLHLARPLPRINVDRQKIEQLMANLLGNAIKYSPQGGGIEVSVRQVRNEEELREFSGDEFPLKMPCLIVSVADSGIGIPEEELDYIFHKFYRVENRLTGTTSGAGLGLYICKIIVEAHGGHIWASSKVGEGSTFHFSIPVD
jgi:signal transduction histidine kinase